MALPDYQSFMLLLLRLAGDDEEHSMREAHEVLAAEFGLADEELRGLLPSGRQTTFENRVGWARTYMKKAGLLESPRRGYFRVTERGQQALSQNPSRIGREFLMQYPEFVDFQRAQPGREDRTDNEGESERTPEEGIESGYQRVRQQLAAELLTTLKSCSPAFFERLVVDLLVKMGYGGTRLDAGQAIGSSGDGGIDGIIKEDRLGLTSCTSRRSDGRIRLAAQRSRGSRVRCRASVRARGCLSPHPRSARQRTTMCRG